MIDESRRMRSIPRRPEARARARPHGSTQVEEAALDEVVSISGGQLGHVAKEAAVSSRHAQRPGSDVFRRGVAPAPVPGVEQPAARAWRESGEVGDLAREGGSWSRGAHAACTGLGRRRAHCPRPAHHALTGWRSSAASSRRARRRWRRGLPSASPPCEGCPSGRER